MAIIQGQIVEVKWSSKSKNHYLSFVDEKGKPLYNFTNNNDTFLININHMVKGSNTLINCTCDHCGKSHSKKAKLAFKNEKHFCNQHCSSSYTHNQKEKYYLVCDCCEKSCEVKYYRKRDLEEGKRKHFFCSRTCQGKHQSKHKSGENNHNYNSLKKTCAVCSKEFSVALHRESTAKYCSKACTRTSKKKKITTNCGYCEKEIQTTPSKLSYSKSGKVFCSNKCVGKYNSLTKDNKIEKVCLICSKVYLVKNSFAAKSVTCSRECHKHWQSKYLVGKNANNYKADFTDEMRKHNCYWCKKEYKLKSPHKVKIKNQKEKPLFCSKKCYRDWYAKEWSQQEEWKQSRREKAIEMYENGVFSHTDTAPQKILNEILEDLQIKYVNEYNCESYSIDNYLVDENLMIEVNGTYWHCDPRTYNVIGYQNQYDRIVNDKRKNHYIKNRYGIDILYLWETDLLSNPNMCKLLLKHYIQNKGAISDYDSFNYVLEGNSLKFSHSLLPYRTYSSEKLKEIFIPVNTIKRSQKQQDKWITFKCDNCGQEKEQLISHYKKNQTHSCSRECSYLLRSKNK